MESGALLSGLDVAQVVLYVFWIFFAGLIFYLRLEDRREGYPLEDAVTGKRRDSLDLIWFPPAKTFKMPHGEDVQAPREEHDPRELKAQPSASFPGAPLEPSGNPMLDGVGPAAYAIRPDVPEMTHEATPKIRPMHLAEGFSVVPGDPDPRGMIVIGADGGEAGTIKELWIDIGEQMVRYLEIESNNSEAMNRQILVPMPLARIDAGRGEVNLASVLGSQVAYAPRLQNPSQVTMLEEEKISAYFASGHMYATPDRLGPLL